MDIAVKQSSVSRKLAEFENILSGNSGKAYILRNSIRGKEYEYIFNDYGIPTEQLECLFSKLNYLSIATMYRNVKSNIPSFINNSDDVRKDLNSLRLWENIKADASRRFIDVSRTNEYNLGDYFYFLLYLKCMFKLNKSLLYEKNETLKYMFANIATVNVRLKSSDNMLKEIRIIRERASKNPNYTLNIIRTIQRFNSDTLLRDAKEAIEKAELTVDMGFLPLDEPMAIVENENETAKVSENKAEEKSEVEHKEKTEAENGLADQIKSLIGDIEEIDESTQVKNRITLENLEDKQKIAKHTAFGISIDFDIPDFVRVKAESEVIQDAVMNDKVITCESSDDLFKWKFRVNEKSLENNVIATYANPEKQFELVEETISTLIVMNCMANCLFGMKPDNTEEEVLSIISQRSWLNKVKLAFPYIGNRYFITKLYKPEI